MSTDKSKLDVPAIHAYLSQSSYWAQGRSLATVEKSIQNSLCFGAYKSDAQVGFARVVTDYATFAWLCDVFVLEDHQKFGLGKKLIETVATHPELANIKRILLATRDAHPLYRTYGGFDSLKDSQLWMERIRPA